MGPTPVRLWAHREAVNKVAHMQNTEDRLREDIPRRQPPRRREASKLAET